MSTKTIFGKKPQFKRIEPNVEEGELYNGSNESNLPPMPKPPQKPQRKEERYTAPIVGEDEEGKDETPEQVTAQEVDDMIEGHLIRLYELIKYRRQL